MYKKDLTWNDQQWLICHKTKPNQTTRSWRHPPPNSYVTLKFLFLSVISDWFYFFFPFFTITIENYRKKSSPSSSSIFPLFFNFSLCNIVGNFESLASRKFEETKWLSLDLHDKRTVYHFITTPAAHLFWQLYQSHEVIVVLGKDLLFYKL